VTSNVERQSIAAHLPELRAALEEQRSFRQDQLADLAADAACGSATTAGGVHDEVADALRAGATTALFEIEAAAARIETGSYGTCEICNGQIPLGRLEILPMAATCMRCARARDMRTVNR
jgi:RNA polymerase-binding transcription factor DksA